MITLAERRRRRITKIKQRAEVIKKSGFQGGTLYEKHEQKIRENGHGYMSKHGTLLHYACGNERGRGKVRDRNSYDGTNNWKYKDQRRMIDMYEQEKEYKENK